MVNEQPSILLDSNFLVAGGKVYHFGKLINKYGDGSHPSDSSKSVAMSVVICCHFRYGNGIEWNKPAFFLWSDFIS